MAKAVVVIFFLIGFVIFSIIKYAGAGIKAAYKHVNDGLDQQPNFDGSKKVNHQDQTNVLVKMIAETLNAQITLSGAPSQSSLSEDDFVIGYVGGYAEGCMQVMNIDLNDAERFGILSVTFFDIFGHEKGIELLKPILQNPEEMSGKFANGWTTGVEDVRCWLGSGSHGNKQSPIGLIEHLRGANL